MMIMINNINNKMVLTVLSFSFFTPTQIQLRFIFFFGLLLSFGLGDLRSIDDIQQTDSNSNANGLSLSENEPIEKLPQVKNDQLDLLFGLSGINQNQNVNSNEDLLQTQNDQLDLLSDLSGVNQKQNLPPPEKAKNPLDLLSDSSGTHDTGTQLRDGVQQNPYQKAYPNSNLQPSVPSQKNTLDLLSGLSGNNQYQNLQNTNWNSNSKLPLPAQSQNGHFDYITGVPGNEQLEKLQQPKNANVHLDLLSGTREKQFDALQSGLNQNVNSNEDLLQTQNDQLDLLADLSGVKQKENLPPSEKAKNPLDLLSDSSGTHDTGTQLQDGVQQNPYQKAYPNSNLQPSVPPQKHTLDLLSSSSGMRDNRMEFQQRSYQNANVEALPQPIQNNPYQGTQEPKTPILQPPRALSEYVLHQDFQEPALQHHEDLMARQLDDSADTDNDRGLEETDEENDWYHNADNVRDDIDEKDFDDFGERQNNDDLYDDDDDDDDGYNDDANAHNTAVDPDNVDTEMWSRFESRDKDTDNDDNNEVLDHNNEYYRGRFPTEDILNNLEDEVKKTKPPTAPTNMVLFYTWMILVILIMVIVVSTYQAKCKGLLSNGNRQQMRAVGEDRKRLLDNEFV